MKISKSKERLLKKGVQTFANYKAKLPKDCAVAKKEGHGGHSLRSFTYKGRQVEVETHYLVRVDGKPFATKLMVGADGSVHCHTLPNYAFSSALDLVREVIDYTKAPPKDELAALLAKKASGPRRKSAVRSKRGTRKTTARHSTKRR